MQCPKCRAAMAKVTYASYEIDRCSACKGLWFDMLEHEDLKNIAGSESIDIGDAEVGKETNAIDNISCPQCSGPMVKMVDHQQPHIWFETCHSCFGVFFDAGEFRDLKEETLLDFVKDLKTGQRN